MTEAETRDTTDWGGFGRPIFDDPKARALSRVGVVDVGSNSVRLVVFDGAARSPAYFYNEKVMAGLGAGLAETNFRRRSDFKTRMVAAVDQGSSCVKTCYSILRYGIQ